MPLLYWFLEDIQQTQIAGGFTIVIKSDVACHMWLRHTLMPPQRHAKPVERRGLLIMWDARFCFVAFEDLEQNEAGDTFTHTFTWTGWVDCQTRYFYFWATNAGEPMHSTSCIFSKHFAWVAPPPPTIFYSDKGHGLVTVDGSVENLALFLTFAQSRDGPGTHAYPDASHYNTWMRVSGARAPANWYEFGRFVMLFDMSAALGFTVASAKYYFWGVNKTDNEGKNPALNIFASNPASDNNLIPADFQCLGVVPFGITLPYATFDPAGWNSITLNALGLAHINSALSADGIVRLGIREELYDAANIDPFPWTRNRIITFQWHDIDVGASHDPYLEVAYV